MGAPAAIERPGPGGPRSSRGCAIGWRRGLRALQAPWIVWALLIPGHLHAHGTLDESLARATRELEEQPDDPERWARRAELYRVHRDWSLAHADLDRAAALAPAWRSVDLYRARLLLDQGEATEAERLLSPLVTAEPGNAPAHAMHGRALAGLGRGRAAADAYTRAIAIRASPGLYLARARALTADHPESAIASLDEGMAAIGPNPALVRTAIDLELARGNLDGALRRVHDRVAAPGRSDPWLVERGEILERAGRVSEARAAYTTALSTIHALPDARRRVPATAQLEARAAAGLDRIEE